MFNSSILFVCDRPCSTAVRVRFVCSLMAGILSLKRICEASCITHLESCLLTIHRSPAPLCRLWASDPKACDSAVVRFSPFSFSCGSSSDFIAFSTARRRCAVAFAEAEAVDVKLARETLLHVPYLCALFSPFLLSDYIVAQGLCYCLSG